MTTAIQVRTTLEAFSLRNVRCQPPDSYYTRSGLSRTYLPLAMMEIVDEDEGEKKKKQRINPFLREKSNK